MPAEPTFEFSNTLSCYPKVISLNECLMDYFSKTGTLKKVLDETVEISPQDFEHMKTYLKIYNYIPEPVLNFLLFSSADLFVELLTLWQNSSLNNNSSDDSPSSFYFPLNGSKAYMNIEITHVLYLLNQLLSDFTNEVDVLLEYLGSKILLSNLQDLIDEYQMEQNQIHKDKINNKIIDTGYISSIILEIDTTSKVLHHILNNQLFSDDERIQLTLETNIEFKSFFESICT